jgi:hypothetical protein
MINLARLLKKINPEIIIWISGLIILAAINPNDQSHFSICPFHNLGFKYCPGCGLGHSISYLFHGSIRQSIECHILGIPAVVILTYRIISLLKKSFVPAGKISTTSSLLRKD